LQKGAFLKGAGVPHSEVGDLPAQFREVEFLLDGFGAVDIRLRRGDRISCWINVCMLMSILPPYPSLLP
jgi:hypothetical protein